MAQRTVPLIIAFLLTFTAGFALKAEAQGQSFNQVLYVDAESGTNAGPGTQDQPLATIQEAADRARRSKQNGRSTRVEIAPGMYRERVQFAFSNVNGGGSKAYVEIRGAGSRGGEDAATVISCSEVYTNWTDGGGDGTYEHVWTKDWGVGQGLQDGYSKVPPSEGGPDDPDIVNRREMVFVGGVRMRQVLTASEMGPGRFRVDEAADRLYLQPPSGTRLQTEENPSGARVEVAEREEAWKSHHEDNFLLKGIRAQHCATPWQYGRQAVQLAGNNIVAEDIAAVQNNFEGLRFAGSNITVTDFRAVENGHTGWGMFKLVGGTFTGGEIRSNNWRGYLGGYVEHTMAGAKFQKVYNLEITDSEFTDNRSRGLWLDNDFKHVLIEDVLIADNLHDNLWLEKIQGPATLRRVTSRRARVDMGHEGYGGWGAVITNSENITFDQVNLIENERGPIFVSGSPRMHPDGSVGGNVIVREFADLPGDPAESTEVWGGHFTLTQSVMAGIGNPAGSVSPTPGTPKTAHALFGTIFGRAHWAAWTDSYSGYGNTWFAASSPSALEWEGDELITLAEWQQRTGQDQGSVFEAPENDSSSDGSSSDDSSSDGSSTNDSPTDDAAECSVAEQDSQSVTLREGWNIVSLGMTFEDNSLTAVLSDVLSEVVLVKDERGQIFFPNEGINTIGGWETSEAYMIYALESATLQPCGLPILPGTEQITLRRGWNFLPYFGDAPLSVEEALGSIYSKIVLIKDERGRFNFPEHGIDTMGDLQPGKGYKVYVSENATFTYPVPQ